MSSQERIENNGRLDSPELRMEAAEVPQSNEAEGEYDTILAADPVLLWENRMDFNEYHDTLLEQLNPEGALELLFAERFVLQAWRLLRIAEMENEIMCRCQYREQRHTELIKISVYEARVERSMYRALKELRQIKANKRKGLQEMARENPGEKASAAAAGSAREVKRTPNNRMPALPTMAKPLPVPRPGKVDEWDPGYLRNVAPGNGGNPPPER